MKRIALLDNPIQEYAWGSRTAIASLLGRRVPSERPEAELWMGAHPRAPSRLASGESLPDAICGDPEGVLGPDVARRFGAALPFLFKLLAADEPLSLQAHPDARQAAEGFAREEARGIPRDAPERCYRDPRPKPELLCALGPFDALVGFRGVADILAGLDRLGLAALAPERAALRAQPTPAGLERFLAALLARPPEAAAELARQAADAALTRVGDDPDCAWICALHERHPGDAGVLAPLLLQRVRLEPGEALFLRAGELHSYLHGVGIELMGNSDNVLRGGLTPKHVDVPELLRVLSFEARGAAVVRPRGAGPGVEVYDTPAQEFELSAIRARADTPFVSPAERGVEILLCTEGACRVEGADGEGVALARGGSALVPAAAGGYRVAGDATLYRASVPRA